MSQKNSLITRDSPANVVLGRILSDQVRYPCLSSFIFQLAESLDMTDRHLADDCWEELNLILGGRADPGSVRRFAARHGRGYGDEARAFRQALAYLIDEDEGRRTQYLALSAPDRRHFVKCRLLAAQDFNVEHCIAL